MRQSGISLTCGYTHTPLTALAFEGKEVELPAEGHLAVRAYRFDIADGQFAEGFVGGGLGWARVRHDYCGSRLVCVHGVFIDSLIAHSAGEEDSRPKTVDQRGPARKARAALTYVKLPDCLR